MFFRNQMRKAPAVIAQSSAGRLDASPDWVSGLPDLDEQTSSSSLPPLFLSDASAGLSPSQVMSCAAATGSTLLPAIELNSLRRRRR